MKQEKLTAGRDSKSCMSKRNRKSGNHTANPQWLYMVVNPTLALPLFGFALATGLPLVPAAFLASFFVLVKVGITGVPKSRFRAIHKASPGIDIPVRLAWIPGAYYIEQAIHFLFFPFRLWSWGNGAGKSEWFIALPGVVGVIVYTITLAI